MLAEFLLPVKRHRGEPGLIATGTGKKTPGGIGAVPRPPVRPCVSRLPRPFLNRGTWWDFGNHGKYIIVCELFAAFRTAAVHHHGSGQFEETRKGDEDNMDIPFPLEAEIRGAM